MNEELKPCPFCGGAARIESNRDWHRLYANHDDDCVLDADDHDLMYPAQPGYLIEIAHVWNRRTPVSGEVAEESDGAMYARMSAAAAPDDLMAAAERSLEVAAQVGIDHAKRAEGEREAFESWWDGWRLAEWRATLTTDELDMPMPDGWARGLMRHAWNGWQARGQQAGAPEGWAADLRAIDKAMQHMGDALNEIDAVEADDEEVATPGFEAIARLLAAIPRAAQ